VIAGAVTAAVCAALSHELPAASAERDARRIYVTVVDAQGKPVTDLTAADFVIDLDGRPQEVTSGSLAVDPMSIVILTDRLGLDPNYTAFDVGQALQGFVDAIRKRSPDSRIALTTFDGIVLQVTRFTSAPAELDRALGRLQTTAPDAVLLEALADVCKSMRMAPTDRRIIFTLLAAYRPDQSTLRNDAAAELLRLSGASLWTVEARQAQRGNYGNNTREVVLDTGAQMSGGYRDIVTSRTGVVASTKHMAELMLSQYALTFGPGGGSAQSHLRVGIRRPGVRILSPGWTPR
jgi:VWFA-related protein